MTTFIPAGILCMYIAWMRLIRFYIKYTSCTYGSSNTILNITVVLNIESSNKIKTYIQIRRKSSTMANGHASTPKIVLMQMAWLR